MIPAFSRTVLPVLALVAACNVEEPDAGGSVWVPEDIEIHWDDSFNAMDDGLVAVVPVDVMVYERSTGEPRAGALVEVRASDAAVLLDGDLTRAPADACADNPPDCTLWWDAVRDQYYQLADSADPSLNALLVRTDAQGIARVVLVVDSLVAEGSGFAPAVVQVGARGVEPADHGADGGDASFVILAR
jgi:hypothetical protein